MTTLRNVTHETILKAIKEYDKLGADAFHAKHGTSAETKYVLRHGGKSYPSKAIVAAAAGLSPKEFSGGQSRLGKLLERAGFVLGVLAMTAAAPRVLEAAHEDFKGQADKGQVEGIYFASGSSRPADIRGFKAVGQALGVTASEIGASAEDELYGLAGTGIPLFVDSGAFSEVTFGPQGPEVVKPMSEETFQDVMDLYARLGAVLGEQLYVVAPDKVGFQQDTLSRLGRWKNEIQALRTQGVNVIVVAQKGTVDQVEFDKQVQVVLGTSDYVCGLPCNKNATSVADVKAFAAARKPARLHLLGIGLRSDRAPEMAKAVAEVSPETILSFDSCLITESVGSTNGRASHPFEKKGGPRILTAAKQKARELIAKGLSTITQAQELAIILAFGTVA